MHANKARAITEGFSESEAVTEIVKYAHQQIGIAAASGFSATNQAFKTATGRAFNEACRQLEGQGYKIKHESDQREGKSWVTVSW